MGRPPASLALGLLATVYLAGCASSRGRGDGVAGPAAIATAGPETLAMGRYFRRLRIVDVVVGGKAWPFLFDTGAGLTVVSEELATATGCARFGRLTGHRFSGERVDFPRCTPVEIALGTRRFSGELAIFDFGRVLPRELPTVHGALSLATLEHTPFTLELAADRIVLESDESLARRVSAMRPLQVRLGRDAGGAAIEVFVAFAAQPGPIWLKLDSGNIDVVMLSPEAARGLGVAGPAGGGEEVTAVLTPVGLAPVSARVRVVPMIYDGNVGAEVMERFVLTFDLARGRAWAAPAGASEPTPP